MAYRPSGFSGCAVSFLIFAFLGVPLLALLMLGERSCDMHIGPPCAISWGWMKFINLVVVIAVCGLIGLIVQLVGNAHGRDRRNDG